MSTKSTSIVQTLSEWDESTHITKQEHDLLDEMNRLLIPTLSEQKHTQVEVSEVPSVDSVQAFYKCNPLDSDFKTYNEESKYLDKLLSYRKTCQDLLQTISNIVLACEEIQSSYKSVCDKTGNLHEDCEKLVIEREELMLISNTIQSALDHFDDMTEFSNELDKSTSVINVALFSSSLKKLDEALAFLLANPTYREAQTYISKYRLLQSRALAQLRDYVLTILRSGTYQIQSQISKITLAKLSSIEEVQLLYIDYRAAIDVLQPIIHEIELRANRKEYTVFITDCFDCYYQQRTHLVSKLVQFRISTMLQSASLTSFVRDGCSFIIRICSEEDQLFKHFFACDLVVPMYKQLIDSFCDQLYEGLRTMLIQENKIDVLCEIVDILRNEVLGSGIKPKGLSASAFDPMIHHMVQDVQERLIYRTSSFISDFLRIFKPTAEEMNYPDILQAMEDADPMDLHNYFPTLELTISILQKLHKSVDNEVFTGLAQEAVSICTNSFIDASKKISEKKGIIDGELFLIRHLKMLNEQVSQFGSQLSQTQISLDFSNVSDGMLKFLKGQTTFRVSSFIFDIMSQSRPKIIHNNVDSKRNLEEQLSKSYESFILNTCRGAFDPYMVYMKRMSTTSEPITDTSEVLVIHEKITLQLPQTLRTVSEKIPLYIPDPSTQQHLLKAIKANIATLYDQVLQLIQDRCTDQEKRKLLFDSLWEKKDLDMLLTQNLPALE